MTAVAAPPERFNFAAHLLAVNAQRAGKTAFADDSGTLSYGELDERVRGLCSHILCDLERHYLGEVREGDFFEGKGVDALYMHFHKLNEFIGLTRLPTFLCNDVIKNPQVEQYLADYQAHLEKVFG